MIIAYYIPPFCQWECPKIATTLKWDNPFVKGGRGDFKDAPVQQKSKAACETTSKEHD